MPRTWVNEVIRAYVPEPQHRYDTLYGQRTWAEDAASFAFEDEDEDEDEDEQEGDDVESGSDGNDEDED